MCLVAVSMRPHIIIIFFRGGLPTFLIEFLSMVHTRTSQASRTLGHQIKLGGRLTISVVGIVAAVCLFMSRGIALAINFGLTLQFLRTDPGAYICMFYCMMVFFRRGYDTMCARAFQRRLLRSSSYTQGCAINPRHILYRTLPLVLPSSRYSCPAAASSSPNTLSTTTSSLPVFTQSNTSFALDSNSSLLAT